MRPVTIAKKDYRDAIRSKALWALTVLFVLFLAGMAYLYTVLQSAGQQAGGQEETVLQSLDLINFLVGPAALLVPIVGLVIAHKSIAGEVESGSGKFLLSAPFTRRDVILGKVLGRTAVLWTALLAGFVVAAVVIALLYDQFDLVAYAAYTLLTLGFGLAYVSVGVGLSALTRSSSRAVVLAVSFFVAFEVLWGLVRNALWYLLHGEFSPPIEVVGGTPAIDAPGWYFFLPRLAPSGAYGGTVTGLVTDQSFEFAATFPDSIPIYLTGGAALVVLAAWVVIPPALGHLRFRDLDL